MRSWALGILCNATQCLSPGIPFFVKIGVFRVSELFSFLELVTDFDEFSHIHYLGMIN